VFEQFGFILLLSQVAFHDDSLFINLVCIWKLVQERERKKNVNFAKKCRSYN